MGGEATWKLHAHAAVVRSANVQEASCEDILMDRQAIIPTKVEYMTSEKATK